MVSFSADGGVESARTANVDPGITRTASRTLAHTGAMPLIRGKRMSDDTVSSRVIEAVTVVVPTFNEAPNVAALIARVRAAVPTLAEIIFVDDSTDDTPDVIAAAAETADGTVRLIHREAPDGGLGGAVVAGIAAARTDDVVVMDGDLQHPPEVIAQLLERAQDTGADVVVASRYVGDGTADGLSDRMRVAVSRVSTTLTKSMFPLRLRQVTDPMTGFFLVNRSRINWDNLRPRGFKILLEILARQNLRVAEVPFSFAGREAGESKASFKQGARFLTQLAYLRFGRMSAFAVVGAIGAVANLLIMQGLELLGVGYLAAATTASVVTIIGNFLLIEHFVFGDMRANATATWQRFVKSFTFNAIEAVVRIWVLWFVVSTWHISAVLVAAVTLVLAFIVRYAFHALVVYAPRRGAVVRVDESTKA